MQAVKFSQLRSLVLVDCGLQQLQLDALECLETLDVRRNRLTSLPVSIGRCRRLRTLRVASNELRTLPSRQLGGLRRLYAFDCSFNRLKRLPAHLVQCVELASLEVGGHSRGRSFLLKLKALNHLVMSYTSDGENPCIPYKYSTSLR